MADGARDFVAGHLVAILADIKQVPIDSIHLASGDDFLTELGMDSIHAVELMLQLDAVFGLGFGEDPDDVDHLGSFGRLVELVMARGHIDALHDNGTPVGERT